MEASRAELLKFNDAGKNPRCEWHRESGGEKGMREGFRCGAHQDCKVRMRLVNKGAVFYIEKLRDTKHSSVLAVYDRKNAALTKEQKAAFKLRKQGGASATEIMKHDQQEAVTTGAKRKEGEDATGVEGVPFGHFRTHTNSFLQQDEPYRNAFARICTHSLTFPRVHTHSLTFACIYMHSDTFYRSLLAGVASLQAYQHHARELKRPRVKTNPLLMTGKLESRADLLNFMRSHPLPATLEDMNDLKTYAVDGIADIWDTFKEPDGSTVRYCIRTHSYAS